jgi:putative nucleotidyltransferase with HDIG domain
MNPMGLFLRRPPKLVVRTLVATSAAIGLVLVAVFVVLSMDARSRIAGTAGESLDVAERAFADLDQHRQQETLIKLTAVSENHALGEALSRYRAHGSLEPIQREVDRLAGQLGVDALVLTDAADRILASAGPRRAAWPPDQPMHGTPGAATPRRLEEFIERPSALFRASGVTMAPLNPEMGFAYVVTAIDDTYAQQLSSVLRTPVTIMRGSDVIASALSATERSALLRVGVELPIDGTLDLADEPHAVRRLTQTAPVSFYGIESLGLSTHRATRNALQILSIVAVGAVALGALASLWLARALAKPINQLSQQLRQIAEAHNFSSKVARTGSSQELDAFTDTFNQMVDSLQSAEAQTELAYVGAIKALAAALDARDAYTAGHSERVSTLSVLIGRQMGLEQRQLDILRLGALLHDIGKIGVADRVLQKNGPLTQDEFELIKMHPTLGAHILRQIPFLSEHIPIVELHHERPDGRGYPKGLLGYATPLHARIVHVADAFDAMTTARAYRPAQTTSHAISELWRYAGSQFDSEVVEAFVAAWSAMPVGDDQNVATILASASATVLPFDRGSDQDNGARAAS